MLARTYRSLEPFDRTVTHFRGFLDLLLHQGSAWSMPRPEAR